MHLFCETDTALRQWMAYGIGLTTSWSPRDRWRKILN